VDLDKAGERGRWRRVFCAILLAGLAVGNLFEEQKVFDVVVWGTPEIREDVTTSRTSDRHTDGATRPLGDVANVTVEDN
jgi:Cu/Ag efflux pump CusA